jgi:hypothetical protein
MVIESGAPVTPTERANVLPLGHKGVALNSTLYLGFALTIAFVVAFGFAQTFRAAVVHPRFPLPWILYFHIGLFAAWVLLFVTQAAFIRFNRRRWHRRLGLAGVAVGAPIPIVGVATAISMACFHVATGHPHAVSSLAVPFSDMLAFSIAFWLAIYWRRNPSFHARSMLLTSCALTAAAFARFPEWLVPEWLVPNGFFVRRGGDAGDSHHLARLGFDAPRSPRVWVWIAVSCSYSCDGHVANHCRASRMGGHRAPHSAIGQT